MQIIKRLNSRLDAMTNNNPSFEAAAMLTKEQAIEAGITSDLQYLRIHNKQTGATFYYPDNKRLTSAKN